MFIKIAEQQIKYFNFEVICLINKANCILDFCYTPILNKDITISRYQKIKLKKIIKKVEQILNILDEIKPILNMTEKKTK